MPQLLQVIRDGLHEFSKVEANSGNMSILGLPLCSHVLRNTVI